MSRLIEGLHRADLAAVLRSRRWPAGLPVVVGTDYLAGAVDITTETAVHEAGHAVVWRSLGATVLSARLEEDGLTGATDAATGDVSEVARLAGMWGGGAAVRYWLDRQGLLDEAAEVDVAASAAEDTAQIMREATAAPVILQARRTADAVVAEHFDEIMDLALRLIEKGELTEDEIMDPALADA